MVSLWFHKLIPCPEQAQYLRWGVSLIELVPVWRRVGIPQAVSRSVGRSCTPLETAPAWYARHDSGLSSAASLSFLLTDRIVDEKTEWSQRETAQRPEKGCSSSSVYGPTEVLFSQNMTHFRAAFPSSFIKLLDHFISVAQQCAHRHTSWKGWPCDSNCQYSYENSHITPNPWVSSTWDSFMTPLKNIPVNKTHHKVWLITFH